MGLDVRALRGRRKLALVLGVAGLAALPVLGFTSLASAADSGTDGATATSRPARPALTDAQQACLATAGFAPPAKPTDGSRPAPPTAAQREALQQAAAACGVTLPAGRGPGGPGAPGGPGGLGGPRRGPALTDAQKACLANAGLTPPAKPTDGSRPAPPTAAQREALQQVAAACGVTLPAGPGSRSA